ncbi:MAG TPA: preprotein translocase subunit SecY [Candidatus Dojkabacteria bacterium]|nr:preprotein translocase subunit SecY [Candidatus Dojkabacteria bacterium]
MEKLSEKLKSIWKTEEIRKKMIFSLMIMVIYRILSAIPVSGIPADAIKQLFEGTGVGEVLSTVSGGVLETASIVAIGLTPYINSSIIFQLLGTVIPKLEELGKEGQEGRRKISMYTRIVTVPLAILQSFVIYSSLLAMGLIPKLGTLELIGMSATLTAGSVVMMWFGELVSESGLGGGSSYLIMLGILSGIPGTIRTNFLTMDSMQKVVFTVISLLLVTSVVFITQAERRVKIQYSRRVRAGGAMESYIPIKPTQSGVMPVIFAMAFISFPQLIGKFLVSKNYNQSLTDFVEKILEWLGNPYIYNSLIFVLIIAFSFFYLTVVFKTDELAENLQKQGAFIQGIRPGENTSEYLRKISFRLTTIGAIFLAVLSILPDIFVQIGLIPQSVFSGTGLLIVVGVILEIKRQIESMITVRSYNKYL